jgi:hypothetical protein
MRALAGPAMLLVVVGGFMIHRVMSKDEAPARDFVELELAADDADHTGTCYSLSTVLIANGVFGNAARSWSAPDKGNKHKWTLSVDNVRQEYNGPVHEYQRFTFEKFGEQLRLVSVDASPGFPTEVAVNIDRLLEAPNARKSTPVDRCLKDGGNGYHFRESKQR